MLFVLLTLLAQPPAPPPAGPMAGPAAAPGTPLTAPKPVEWPKEIGGKPLSHFVAELGSKDPSARWLAVRTLPYFGPTAARTAVPQVLRLFDDPDPGVRVNAILVMTDIGFDNRPDLLKAVASLQKSVRTTVRGSAVRVQVAKCLGLVGPDAADAVPTLIELSNDSAWETRDAAAAALGRAGGPVYEAGAKPGPDGLLPPPKRPASATARNRLVELLKDDAEAVRLEAIQSLLLIGTPHFKDVDQYVKECQPTVDGITARLAPPTDKQPGEAKPQVRLWLHALLLMYDDRHAPIALKEITNAMGGSDRGMKVQALTALAVCGPLAGRAVDELRAALTGPEPEVAAAALGVVVKLGPADGRKVLADVQRLTTHADPYLKGLAEATVKALTPGAAK